MTKPKILLVCSDGSQTGAPNQVATLASVIQESAEINCICPDGWLKDKLCQNGIKVYPWPEGSFNSQKIAISKLYEKIQPDVIHCHSVRAVIVGLLAKRPNKSKVLYTEHLWTQQFHLKNPIRERLQHHLLSQATKKSDWVIAVSQAVADFIVKKHHADPQKVSVIFGTIKPMPHPTNKPNRPMIGTLGSINPIKGIPTLLEAVVLLKPKFPELRCLIGGDGPNLEEYENLAQSLKIDKNCEWLGEVKNPVTFYSKLTIYIQPSYSESFGLAAGEAMSAGIPVIVSDVGGLPELIGNDGGLLFSPKNSQELADQVEKLLNSPELYQKYSTSGQKRANEFSKERFKVAHLKLYDRLLSE